MALKTVASGVCASSGRGGGGGSAISKGLFRELRALQMAGECPYIVGLLDVYPEVCVCACVILRCVHALCRQCGGMPVSTGRMMSRRFFFLAVIGLVRIQG